MTDTIEHLNTIRDHLRTGRFGQREVWEEWLTEAAADNERLRAVITRAKDALLDGQSTQWVHDLLVAELTRRALEPKP